MSRMGQLSVAIPAGVEDKSSRRKRVSCKRTKGNT